MSEINFNIEIANKLYDKLTYWKKAKEYISKYFNDNQKEKTYEIILIKVLLIDGLYSTNLKTIKEGNGVLKVADLIKELYDQKNLLNLILKGDKEAFQIIESGSKNQLGIEQSIFSFATKYCHFHNPEKFPIYDQYVCATLKDLKIKSNFGQVNLENFYDIMELLKKTKSFEELDKFLWLYGMKLKYEKGNTKINKEVINIFKDNPDFLLDLSIK